MRAYLITVDKSAILVCFVIKEIHCMRSISNAGLMRDIVPEILKTDIAGPVYQAKKMRWKVDGRLTLPPLGGEP